MSTFMVIMLMHMVGKSSECLFSVLLRSRAPAARNVVVASGKKTDLKKQGLESIKNAVVKKNLMGVSESMNKKGWTDPSGRKGKVQPAQNLAKA
jgi:hypothetical protein